MQDSALAILDLLQKLSIYQPPDNLFDHMVEDEQFAAQRFREGMLEHVAHFLYVIKHEDLVDHLQHLLLAVLLTSLALPFSELSLLALDETI